MNAMKLLVQVLVLAGVPTPMLSGDLSTASRYTVIGKTSYLSRAVELVFSETQLDRAVSVAGWSGEGLPKLSMESAWRALLEQRLGKPPYEDSFLIDNVELKQVKPFVWVYVFKWRMAWGQPMTDAILLNGETCLFRHPDSANAVPRISDLRKPKGE